MRIIIIILICLPIAFCNGKNQKYRKHERFEADVNPAFSERSLLTFFWKHDTPALNILIRNNIRVDETEDTFYYKIAILKQPEFIYFDSLFKNWPQPWKPHAVVIVDGIHFKYTKFSEHDTSKLELHGPSFRNDSFGFRMTSTLLYKFSMVFQDSLINYYFQELRSYINADSNILNGGRQALFERREIKYGWK